MYQGTFVFASTTITAHCSLVNSAYWSYTSVSKISIVLTFSDVEDSTRGLLISHDFSISPTFIPVDWWPLLMQVDSSRSDQFSYENLRYSFVQIFKDRSSRNWSNFIGEPSLSGLSTQLRFYLINGIMSTTTSSILLRYHTVVSYAVQNLRSTLHFLRIRAT